MKEENIIEELKRKVEEGGQVTRAVFRYLLDCECPFGSLFRELQVVCAVGRVQNARAGVRIN